MIDRQARDQLIENIQHLVAGLISNDEAEDRMPWNSKDPAIQAVFVGGPWQLYSDSHQHKLDGKNKVSEAQQFESARWILFLETDLPYEWPLQNRLSSLLWLPLHLLTLGLTSRYRQNRFSRNGDVSVWPFLRYSDYSSALKAKTGSGVAP